MRSSEKRLRFAIWALPRSHRKYADFGESRVTDLGTQQCCILATQGKIINANHVPITIYIANAKNDLVMKEKLHDS